MAVIEAKTALNRLSHMTPPSCCRSNTQIFVSAVSFALSALPIIAKEPIQTVNSVEMTLVQIEPGSFEMGVDSVPLPLTITKGLSGASWDRTGQEGDYDEVPVHKVTISRPLLMSQTEVTAEQYRQFRPDYQENKYWSPYAAGISWQDAVAFC
jgi:formylglycine-generating enzyme required for sulfatase activity